MRVFFLLILGLFLSGCVRDIIDAEVRIVKKQQLASNYVNTPDPRRYQCFYGQDLFIRWSLPKQYLKKKDLHLLAIIRYRSLEEETIIIPLNDQQGDYILHHINERYSRFGPILSYKVDLIGDNQTLYQWEHVLWTDLIHFEKKS